MNLQSKPDHLTQSNLILDFLNFYFYFYFYTVYLILTNCALFQFTMSSDVNQAALASRSDGECTHTYQATPNVYQQLQHQQPCDTGDVYEDVPMATAHKPIGQMNAAEISNETSTSSSC